MPAVKTTVLKSAPIWAGSTSRVIRPRNSTASSGGGAAQELMHPGLKPKPQQPFAHGHGAGRSEAQRFRLPHEIGEIDMRGEVSLAWGVE